MAGFTHAGNNQPPLGVGNQLDGGDKFLAEAIGQLCEAGGFGGQLNMFAFATA